MSRFVIRRVRTGPPDLNAQLPVTGCTVDTGPADDDDAYFADLDRPLRYRTPAAGFLEICQVVLRPHKPNTEPYAGMRGFPFHLSLVVDGAATIDNVAVIEVDDQDDAPPGPGTEPAAQRRIPGSSVIAQIAEEFTARLDHTLSQLAKLAGEHTRGEMVEPRRVDATEHVAAQPIPVYSLAPGRLRYHTHDPLEGWVQRDTADPDELLYWVVNDITSEVAWRWAQQTPAFSTMSERRAQRTLWLPYWHILMHGLRPEWGSRVREIIRGLADPDAG